MQSSMPPLLISPINYLVLLYKTNCDMPLATSSRPRLDLPATPADRLLDGLALATLIALLVLPFAYYGGLPDRIPIHFGLDGQPDKWGGKKTLLLLPAVGLVISVLLTLVNRHPHKFNYLVEITPENAERQYRNAMLMIRVLRLLILLLFLYITWAGVQTALSRAPGLGGAFAFVLVGAISGLMLFFVFRSVQSK